MKKDRDSEFGPPPIFESKLQAQLPTFLLDLNVDDKYRVILHKSGKLEALRYGQTWRDLSGDNLVLSLAQQLENDRALLKEAYEVIKGVNAVQGDNYIEAMVVIENKISRVIPLKGL